jgi:hypothetical protein
MTGYDADFALWLAEQAALLRERRFGNFDQLPGLFSKWTIRALGVSTSSEMLSNSIHSVNSNL